MRFGIDFGTTRTVIAAVDRGNYPVVPVTDTAGDSHDYIPTVIAQSADGELIFGWEAMAEFDNPTLTRSFKRVLSGERVSGTTPVTLDEGLDRPIEEVLTGFARYVIAAIEAAYPQEPIEVVLGVPANSHSAQRLETMAAFSAAGATVLGLINEPSAAAFEYSHRHASTLNSKRSSVIVYDLGGGTFDASLVHIDGGYHTVVATAGIARLGGDDFDQILAEMALAQQGTLFDALPLHEQRNLLREARLTKEAIAPQTKRVVLETDSVVTIAIGDYYAAAQNLVELTIQAMEPLLESRTDIAGIYLVGGATALPLVPRILRERFGRRVHRSPLPSGSTAVGLAIAADGDSGFSLDEKLSRSIGVFREWDDGSVVSLDELVPATAEPPMEVSRQYRAAHNVGWFRYVEYSSQDSADYSLLAEVAVPFEKELVGVDLRQVDVHRTLGGPLVRETVEVDGDGITTISIDVPDIDVHITV
ncbi:MAG: Hsp70 family protein [Corynebacterium sp.]|nr:Hsp70 family protein [Corynebacterium sp.]